LHTNTDAPHRRPQIHASTRKNVCGKYGSGCRFQQQK